MRVPRRSGRRAGRKMLQVNFRVGEWEKAQLDELAKESGLSLTEYLLASTVYAGSVSGDSYKELREVSEELRAQGVNLNQAMRLANSLHMQGREVKAKDAIGDIAKMRESVVKAHNDVLLAISRSRPHRFFPEDFKESDESDYDEYLEDEDW